MSGHGKRCHCTAMLAPDGTCPWAGQGCDAALRAPAARRLLAGKRARPKATGFLLGHKETTAGAARAIARKGSKR